MNGLGLEEVCKGYRKNLHSFTIATFGQNRLLGQAQKTSPSNKKAEWEKGKEKNCQQMHQSIFKIQTILDKSKRSVVFTRGNFKSNISNVTGYAAEFEQRFLTAQSDAEPCGCFYAIWVLPSHASP